MREFKSFKSLNLKLTIGKIIKNNGNKKPLNYLLENKIQTLINMIKLEKN